MTIQRQYVLPNCSLLLEGLSTDASNVLSVLANAEFKIVGLEQPLTGGTDFFKAVASTVSAYCQRLLSGLDHPGHLISQSALVAMEPGEGQYHRLLVKPELLDAEATDGHPQTINLSTVQLFDMAEAIDQFFADSQTLPDFSVPLVPLARRHVRSQEPMAQRALPPVLGIATLAVAGLGLFFLPVPEVSEETLTPPAPLEESIENPLETSPPSDEPSSEVPATDAIAEDPIEGTLPPLTDDQLTALQQQVQQQISGALPADAAFEQALTYQVSVAENGDILGYNPTGDEAVANLDSTPLPALTYIPVDPTTVNPVAQFDVTFGTDGTVDVVSQTTPGIVTPEAPVTPEVVTPTEPEEDNGQEEEDSPTDDSSSEQSSAPAETSTGAAVSQGTEGLSSVIDNQIQDPDLVFELNQELRRAIINNREPDWAAPEVRYRIRLDESGQTVGYEAVNDEARQQANALKIPDMVKASNSDKPQLDFLVVIDDGNVVQVNPWDGWP
ncbi:MAG: DUF4335 domain-containing protein [Cyanobacteria bacterium P01_D01_bin.156]